MSTDNVTTPTPTPQPTPEASSAATTTAAPAATPAAVAKPKPVAPSASLTQNRYGQADMSDAQSFGRVAEDGTVFVREGETEREVGQFAGASSDEALSLYARRYLDLKAKLNHSLARFESSSIKVGEIDATLKTLREELVEPAVVGNIEALRDLLKSLEDKGAQVKESLAQAHAKAVEVSLAKRTEIVEQVEALVAGINESTNWRATGDKITELFNQWQEAQRSEARLDRKVADELWGRFSAARSTFNKGRQEWIAAREAGREQARAAKQAIIAKAHEIKDSTAWNETSREFTRLMNEWKKSSRVGRNEDDALWKEFRAAADVFFNARQADRDRLEANEKENLAQKEALLVEAEALVPVKDLEAAKTAREALADIQEKWDTIGFVPRSEVSRLEERMDAVEKQIASVEESEWSRSNPETNARKSDFEIQLTAQLEELDARIAAETDETAKKALQSERDAKAQWLSAVQQ